MLTNQAMYPIILCGRESSLCLLYFYLLLYSVVLATITPGGLPVNKFNPAAL